ncbi:MAG: Smr/MutS family protein [Acidobacteria bacterium]|nr:Smr/MutS family protein [Acidobacteriota bacterium]MBS1867244.1 Smr/MutS family protein [Acidobacteriota bacterium]
MSRSAQEILEFDKLRELLRGRSTCAPGKRALDALAFSRDREKLQRSFALIREAREWLRAGKELGFGALADPERWLATIEGPGTMLEVPDFLDAASLLDTASWLRQQFRDNEDKFPLLAGRAESVIDFRDVLALIRRAILPTGEISDDASPELRKIRANILQTRDSIQKSLKQILRARNAEAGEDYVTLRNDRFVIPVRSEQRRGVPGIVHGASGTGQTVFVEPLETVDANNQLVQYSEEEAAEIFRILRGLTERLRMARGPLVSAVETIAELDSTFARARFARDFDAAIPEFSARPELEFVALRHPVLEDKLRKENRAIVPMTLALGGDQKLLVISGPNTGGKTVALKSTGIAALSAQCGIPVAAQRVKLPIFDHVLVDIGDEQSIAADLSTFSSHMLNLKSILASATPDSLVLVDEMGTGTAPEEGAALAVALLDEFRTKNCFVLATTHHDRLKTYAASSSGVVNAAVEFDEVNLRPTYRLTVGVPGGSSGIAIAQRLGLAPRIIERARELMAPESLEAADLIAYLHRTRDELDRMQAQMTQERHALEEERKKLRNEWLGRQQKRIADLEAQFAEMQKRFEHNVASVVEAVKDRELRAQLEKTSRRKLQEVRRGAKEDLNAAIVQTISDSQTDLGVTNSESRPVAVDSLQAGAKIRVKGFAKPLIFRRLDGNSAEVEAGPLRMKVALDEIIGIEDSRKSVVAPGFSPASSGVSIRTAPREASAATEINVIGMTVEQATELVDKFLDDAALAHLPQVRIIHGHGTGALRKGLGEYLRTQPLVARASFENEERGGKAITVVELRG